MSKKICRLYGRVADEVDTKSVPTEPRHGLTINK